MSATAPATYLRWMAQGHEYFTARLEAIGDERLDGPSALPGWSGRHLLSHVGHNATALARLAHWAATGEPTPMYPSPSARAEEIESGARWPASRLRDFVEEEQERLDTALDKITDEGWRAAAPMRPVARRSASRDAPPISRGGSPAAGGPRACTPPRGRRCRNCRPGCDPRRARPLGDPVGLPPDFAEVSLPSKTLACPASLFMVQCNATQHWRCEWMIGIPWTDPRVTPSGGPARWLRWPPER
ncbi:maleylpyruvate isomerase N-terminal domain-containing protein [Streptomyces sp. NPDC021354]|uniref:maleylpyruvate isomerase N-terminal domain-containing protein n=1 Tax=Streptomyces sp. NPDC021354 TaxID=3154793 RepID=UPI0033D032A7